MVIIIPDRGSAGMYSSETALIHVSVVTSNNKISNKGIFNQKKTI